jgi:hypothetical protein
VLVVDALNESVFPEQTGLLEFAIGVAGVSLMITVALAAGEVHPFMVTVTLYVPS